MILFYPPCRVEPELKRVGRISGQEIDYPPSEPQGRRLLLPNVNVATTTWGSVLVQLRGQIPLFHPAVGSAV